MPDDSHLSLNVAYHNPDEGSRYDEVQGGFFTVAGVDTLTPAGRKFEHVWQRSGYVTFG